MLDKGAIFNSVDLPVEKVDVPEWGGSVYVRTLTAAERDAYEASNVRFDGKGKPKPALDNARGRLAALAICDEKGKRIFVDDDAGELGRKSARALDRVCDVARKLSGMDDEAVEDAKGN